MHSLEDVRAEYKRLDKLLGIDTSEIELKISTRSVRQLGSFRSPAKPGAAPLSITIAKFVMEDDALFWDTIRHEYAHAAAFILYPGEKHGHDKLWKKLCLLVGCVPQSRTKLSESAMEQRAQKAKYLVRCETCGSETLYMRRGKTVELLLRGRGRKLRCTKCGGKSFMIYTRK